jgi:rubrerythrin
MDNLEQRQMLVSILKMAYSGERAAALAYAGHWRSVSDPQEKTDIAKIENDEWEHRAIVGEMLEKLGEKPSKFRELLMGSVGCIVYLACFISGWFFPMYFAGRLEHSNVHEYIEAANHAEALGLHEWADELMQLSDVELQHEEFFKQIIVGHWLTPMMKAVFNWGPEPAVIEAAVVTQAAAFKSSSLK